MGDISEHTYLAPSSSERWINCPGSAAAHQAAVTLAGGEQAVTNIDSATGTAAHNLLENCVLSGLPASSFLGSIVYSDAVFGNFVVDDDMVDAVQDALDWIEEYLEEHGRRNIQVYAERRVPIGPQIGVSAAECSGTSDIMLEHIDGSKIVVMDYKHGRGIKVYAKENPQCMLYAAGAREVQKRKYKQYEIVVAQPRAAKRHPIDSWMITDSNLERWLKRTVAPAAALALQPNAPRNAGEWCKWCRAAPTCFAYKAKIDAIAATEFRPLPEVDGLSEDMLVQYSQVLDNAQMIENWLTSVKSHALKILQAGHEIPGWTIGFTRRTKQWDNIDDLRAWLWSHNLDPDTVEPRELLSPAAMLKTLRAHGKIPKKRRNQDWVNPLDAFTKYSTPSLKLVKQDAEEEFTDLTDDE
jgi:hypothetical protein